MEGAPQTPDEEFGLGCTSQEEHDEEFKRGWKLSEAIEQKGISEAAGDSVNAEKSEAEINRINQMPKPAEERVRLGVRREPRELSDLEFSPSPEWERVKRTATGSDAPVPAKPLQRGAAQEAAILAAIRAAGLNPLALPKNEPGKPGPKAAIRQATNGNPLFVGETVFDKAWERLRAQGDIATSSDPTR